MKTLFKIPVLLLALMLIVSSCGNETKSEAKSDADIALMIPNIEKPEGWFDGNFDNQIEKKMSNCKQK